MEQKRLGSGVRAAATLASVHTDCPVDAEGRGEVFQRTGWRFFFKGCGGFFNTDNKDIQITTIIIMFNQPPLRRKLQLKQVKTVNTTEEDQDEEEVLA